MSDRAWMPLYIGDYNADTGHLSVAEHGAYLMLIMHYWQHGGLPADERMIARVSRMTADQWTESRDVLAMLFSEGWTHKRIDAELEKASAIIAKRKAAADAMHDKRRANAHAEQVQSKCSDTRGTTYHHTQEDTDANASDAAASRDVRDVLWSDGAAILSRLSGKPLNSSKSMIGKWLRDVRDDCALVLSKIRQAEADRIGEPVSWITAALKPPDKPPKPKTVGDMFREDARKLGILPDATSTDNRRMAISNGSGEGGGTGGAVILALPANQFGGTR